MKKRRRKKGCSGEEWGGKRRWFTGEEERKCGRKQEGERDEEEMGRMGSGWLKPRRGPRRSLAGWWCQQRQGPDGDLGPP